MNSTASLIPPPLPQSSSSLPFSSSTTTHTTTTPVSRETSTRVVRPTDPRSTITRTHTVTRSSTTITSPPPTTSHSAPAGLVHPNQESSSGGLSEGGKIAIAVVIPVVVVVLLLILGIFLWRRRKQRKEDREARRKEVEEYGYNPNNDPTLPAVAGMGGSDSPEMSEDASGYRGWGNNTTSGTMTARKPSTNLSSGVGMAVSDDGRGISPGSPGQLDGELMMDGAAATGVAAAAGAANRTSRGGNGVNRGTSNASSAYSAAGRTDDSGDLLGGAQQDLNFATYNRTQVGYGDGAAPVIRDVNARRNTKIENAVYPQQGNSGIAQNF